MSAVGGPLSRRSFWSFLAFVTGKPRVLASQIQRLLITKARNWNLALQIVILTKLNTKANIVQNLPKFREKTGGKGAKWTKSSLNASKTPKSSQNPPKIAKIPPKSAEITVLLPQPDLQGTRLRWEFPCFLVFFAGYSYQRVFIVL